MAVLKMYTIFISLKIYVKMLKTGAYLLANMNAMPMKRNKIAREHAKTAKVIKQYSG